MMTNDDVPRSMPFQQGRKPLTPGKYQDNRYSPSSNYNYNYNSNSVYPSQQQNFRRKMDNRFKRDGNGNNNERLMRQNDLIIRLLKEIRDRLPPPPVPAPSISNDVEASHQNGHAADLERTETAAVTTEPQVTVPEAENTETAGNTSSEVLPAGQEPAGGEELQG
jgi:hypothetical protein